MYFKPKHYKISTPIITNVILSFKKKRGEQRKGKNTLPFSTPLKNTNTKFTN